MARRPRPSIIVPPADIITSGISLEGSHVVIWAEAGVNSGHSRVGDLDQAPEQ